MRRPTRSRLALAALAATLAALAATLATLAATLAAGLPAPRAATLPAAGEAEPPPSWPLYDQLTRAELEPAGRLRGFALQADRATMRFDDAALYLLAPVHGVRTGALILGRGRFELSPPDRVEAQQLDKYLDARTVDLAVREVLLRFTDDTAERLAAAAGPGGRADPGRALKTWRDRHERLLEERLLDLDARVAADLAEFAAGIRTADDAYFFAAVRGDEDFHFEIDPLEREEVRLMQTHGLRRQWDNWSSFHRAVDYGGLVPAEGALVRLPVQEQWRPQASTPAITVDAAIDRDGDLDATAELLLRAERPAAVVRLSLSPILEVTEVRWRPPDQAEEFPGVGTVAASIERGPAGAPHEPAGTPLPFLQRHIGRGAEEDRWETRVTVPLPQRLAPGEQIVLAVRYRGRLLELMPNRDYFNRDRQGWIPRHPDARRARFDLTFRTRGGHRVATGGALLAEIERDGRRIERRRVSEPAIGMGFHYGALRPQTYEPEGHPPITVFSSPNTTGFAPGNRERILADITEASGFYQEVFGPRPYDALVLAEVPGFAGQSFPGFLLLSFSTFGEMHTGEAELFRTHELAHQWWGNAVDWDTYHDQWLSEGFAQYAAALFALVGRGDEDKFDDMMRAWGKDVLAKPDLGQRLGMRFYGHGPEVLRDSDGPETGALWLGRRLSSDKTPSDYRLQVYEKGAYVLHMLRMMLLDWDTGEDTRFREMMRAFYAAHRGSTASTEQFLQAVEAAFGEPMDWFFEQWVYGAAVPRYDPDLKARRVAGAWRLRGRVRQRNVPDTFRMPVPVRVRYRDGTTEVFRLLLDRPEVPVDLPLRARPAKIEFNPLHAVLAEVR